MRRLFFATAIALVLFSNVAVFVYFYHSLWYKSESAIVLSKPVSEQLIVSAPVSNEEPIKTDFGIKLPDGFPSDIPIEQGVGIRQGYALDYGIKKQYTVVFLSLKTVTENRLLYEAYLDKNGWGILNKQDDDVLVALYATKAQDDISVTVIGDMDGMSTESQVSISILKKI